MSPETTPIHHLEIATLAMVRTPCPDGGEGADILGRIRKVESDLAEYRRGALAETEQATGGHYQITTTRGRTWSFNWARILHDIANVMGEPLWNALTVLRDDYGVKLTGTKRNLERALRAYEVDFVSGRSDGYDDVGDLDRPHLLWAHKKPTTVVEAKEPPE